MPSEATNVSSERFVKHEILSKSTAPLLAYLLASHDREAGTIRGVPTDANLFSVYKAQAGQIKLDLDVDIQQPIDESFINYAAFTDLIKNSKPKIPHSKTVTIVGAGVSGLCCAYELARAGFDVKVLEASSRVGGRVITFRDPILAPGLHAEGGAMRIPADHFLLHQYISEFGLEKQLFDFEMNNKFIHLSGRALDKRTMTYHNFETALRDADPDLLKLFPGLSENEKKRTCDELFDAAVQPVKDLWIKTYKENKGSVEPPYTAKALVAAYKAITDEYDRYTLRSYLTDVAGWSQDAINLYDLGNAHVVFENGFIESFKDAFLSSNRAGAEAGMKQLQDGMDVVPKAFFHALPSRGSRPVSDLVTFGARVTRIERGRQGGSGSDGIGTGQGGITCYYDGESGDEVSVTSDYLILAIPYTSQRAIVKNEAFAPKQEMAIRDVRYVEVTKVLLQYRRRWWVDVFRQNGQHTDGGVVSDLPIRYTMFPKEDGNSQNADGQPRGAVMAAYTFQQDATELGALAPARRIHLAARNIDTIFPKAGSLALLEAGASQVFPVDELAGGSAFCYFGPRQKSDYLETMCAPDWANTVFFAGEQASYTHGWIQGALEAALRCTLQVYDAAIHPTV